MPRIFVSRSLRGHKLLFLLDKYLSEFAGSCVKYMFIRRSLFPPAVYESSNVQQRELIFAVVQRGEIGRTALMKHYLR